ncbi:MAG: HEPN domain-containing protein [Candidatus Kapabacteria bacterium]|nr:HEPN domain-containing protein [Candidatus Kapabacteria bacterium]
MKTEEEHIEFWISQADDDWNAVFFLYNGKNYLQSLFFAHLVIEKICKALWIKYNIENVPPRTHNLIYLLSFTSIEVSDEIKEFLLTLNRFQLEGNYPEYLCKMRSICDDIYSKSIIQQT